MHDTLGKKTCVSLNPLVSLVILSFFSLFHLVIVSEAPKMDAPKKYTSQEILEMKTDQEKKDEVSNKRLADSGF